MILIEFDASFAVLKATRKQEEAIIQDCLKWIDSKIEMQSRRINYTLDATRYCWEGKYKRFPTGLLPRVCAYMTKCGWEYKTTCLIDLIEPCAEDNIPEWAYDHQRAIVNDVLENYRCIIQSPTASGKSTAIEFLVHKFPEHKILIVAPSINLVNNIHKQIARSLGCPVGKIGGGKSSWERVTVSTSQSLAKKAADEFSSQMNSVDVMIFDECHNYGNASGEKISAACRNSSVRVGLSATPHRADGSDLVLEGVIGPATLVIPDTLMVNLNVIHPPKVFFIEVPDPSCVYDFGKAFSGSKPPRDDVYTKALVHNYKRNELVVSIVQHYQKSNNKGNALILVDHIEHGELLCQMFRVLDMNIPFIAGCAPTKLREETIEQFKKGELRFLIASRILNEGEDVPRLELVVNAAGGSGERGIVQKSGRALRLDPTGYKERAIIVDFYDQERFYLNSNAKRRMRHINERFPGTANLRTLEQLYDAISNN